jgi:hypothetical protein
VAFAAQPGSGGSRTPFYANVVCSAASTQNTAAIKIQGSPLNGGAGIIIDADGYGQEDIGSHYYQGPNAAIGFRLWHGYDSGGNATATGSCANSMVNGTPGSVSSRTTCYEANSTITGGPQEIAWGRGVISGCPTYDDPTAGCQIEGQGMGSFWAIGNSYGPGGYWVNKIPVEAIDDNNNHVGINGYN